jgi:site-specific DNA-methyltransferase (cytosine-N4-specific)
MCAFALRDDGWFLRQEIIWEKPNAFPESVKDRPTRSHEQIFLFSKSPAYYYDFESIQEAASEDTHARYARGRSDTHKWADGGPGNQTIAKSFEHMRKNGVNPKCAEPGSGIRQNESFSAAVKDVVEYRNKRSVWTVPTNPYPEAHFATFSPALILPAVLAGCPPGGTICDPFSGAGTTALVAKANGRKCIGIELNRAYIDMSVKRLSQDVLDLQDAVGQ